jgi:hypothetical protein
MVNIYWWQYSQNVVGFLVVACDQEIKPRPLHLLTFLLQGYEPYLRESMFSVKYCLCLDNYEPCKKTYGGKETRFPTFISWALHESGQLHALSALAPREITSVVHWISGWSNHRCCLHATPKRTIFFTDRNRNPTLWSSDPCQITVVIKLISITFIPLIYLNNSTIRFLVKWLTDTQAQCWVDVILRSHSDHLSFLDISAKIP